MLMVIIYLLCILLAITFVAKVFEAIGAVLSLFTKDFWVENNDNNDKKTGEK